MSNSHPTNNFSTKKGTSEMIEIAKLGGSISSPEKRLAQRLLGISRAKTRKSKVEAIQRVIEMLEDPKLSAANLLLYAEELRESKLNVAQKIRLLEALTRVHSTVHGQKQVSVCFSGEDMAKKMVDEIFSSNP